MAKQKYYKEAKRAYYLKNKEHAWYCPKFDIIFETKFTPNRENRDWSFMTITADGGWFGFVLKNCIYLGEI